MSTFSVAGIQMRVTYGVDNNPKMTAKLDVLMHRFPCVEMVFFSELAAFGPSLDPAQHLPGPAEDAFRKLAEKHGIWLIPGSLPMK